MRLNGKGENMAFKEITTQEEFDAAIQERLDRQKESLLKQYEGFEAIKEENENLKNQVNTLQSEIEKTKGYSDEIAELTGKVKDYELNSLKTKYAMENGIPFKFAGRISGNTEEEIKADAESLSEIFKIQSKPPLKSTENKNVGGEDMSYRNMLKDLKGE